MKMLLCLLALLCFSTAIAEYGLTDFSAVDMDGNEVDQSIFAAYDLTMVNIWATWGDFCEQELPELVKLKDSLPDHLNLITICEDAATDFDRAAQMLEDAGANFQTIIANDELFDLLLSDIHAFPTTIFIDNDGLPVGEPIIGVLSKKNAAQAYAAIFEGMAGA